ncbi:MFS transporter [Sedimentibacter hydroxybenzoicus DSM 7310]|uniref:MFS transporter n=1 Tax=Sedimentibacter hydroxybenzoicus DSM 7310 TaxID=1123245 RepID=A0A974BGN1_SEDHY|nr:MFS transporter [Sedimentibacter hydroxybenzoicus]NYB72809.1 MFS transporter [Sedimentibacter hydroxybenzoicus DSM 7310]
MLNSYAVQKKNYFLFSISFAFRNIAIGIFFLVFNIYMIELEFSSEFLGLFLAAGNISMCVGSIPAGILVDKINKKTLLIVSTITAGFLFLLQSIIVDKQLLILISILYGCSFITLMNITGPYIMEFKEFEKEKNLLISNRAIALISMTVGSLLGGYLSNVKIYFVHQEYRSALIVSAIIYMLAAMPLAFLKDNYKTEDIDYITKKQKSNTTLVKKNLKNIIIFSSVFFSIGFAILLLPFTNLYFKNRFNLSITTLSYLLAVIQVSISLCVYAMSKLIKNISSKKNIICLCLSVIILTIILLLVSNLIIQVILFIFISSLFNVISSAFLNYSLENIDGEIMGTTTGIINTAYNMSESIGIFTASILVGGYHFNFIFILSIVSMIIALFFIFISNNNKISRSNIDDKNELL